MKIKKWLKLIRNVKKMNIKMKDFNNHIQKIFTEFENNKIPVDIIRLCESYGYKPIVITDNINMCMSSIITRNHMEKITNHNQYEELKKYKYLIAILIDDPVKQRLHIAIHFSALYMAMENLCTVEEFKNHIMLTDAINTDSLIYKFAIMLLCPKSKLEEMIRDKGHTPYSLLESLNYQSFIESFLVSPMEFEYRLKLLINEDL